MKTAIVIPARYASTRFPGKPLVKIGGRTMLERVVDIGRAAAKGLKDVRLLVATEDSRIDAHCKSIGVDCAMTPESCPTGSDRVLAAAEAAGNNFDFLISLQGDAPFTPVEAVRTLIQTAQANPLLEVITPVVRLRWSELDALRQSKTKTPFSGTTAIVDAKGFAVWFSKTILPAIRGEDRMRKDDAFSPVLQHLGLYGYRADILKRFVKLPQSPYEQLEGLEQLRFLENGITIRAVEIAVDAGLAQAGIDSPEDLTRAEALVKRLGI
jgi:3-deoxy-manno-octulosonate cytidylyltransferase (CMP-KDO synthetase)